MRKTTGRWLIAAAVVGGLLVSGSTAMAAEAAPSAATHALSTQQQVRAVTPKVSGVKAVPDASTGHICLTNATSYCIKTNGTGNQVTITDDSGDYGNFTVVHSGTVDGFTAYEWQDGNGNCLREGTSNDVKIQNGGCPALGDNTDTWLLEESTTVVNAYYYDIMLTRGAVSGYNVFAFSTLSSGDYAKWNVPK